MVKWLIVCLCAAQQTIRVTLMDAVSPTRPTLSSLPAAAQVATVAPHFHGMPAED